ncbi:MAG: hypothetical protein KDH17_09615 [Rhodocyclaceae bacterium]|nr:hypothetical protein [Rhodocyclaceae bacterium]MCP5234789.1 hypothetical protein [Zoogloeaceae bacterium]
MTDTDGEYKSNLKLQQLAAELSALNSQLIELGLPDNARILRLRMFAESSLAFGTEGDRYFSTQPEDLPRGVNAKNWYVNPLRFVAAGCEGDFATIEEAHTAFKVKDVELKGQRSKFYAEVMEQQKDTQPELFDVFATLARSTNTPRHLQDAFIEIAGCFRSGHDARVNDQTVTSEDQTPGDVAKIENVAHCETHPQSSFRANPVF